MSSMFDNKFALGEWAKVIPEPGYVGQVLMIEYKHSRRYLLDCSPGAGDNFAWYSIFGNNRHGGTMALNWYDEEQLAKLDKEQTR